MAITPFTFNPTQLLKGAEKQLGDVAGGFTGSKEYPPNAMGHLHSTMAFSFVVPESVSNNSKLGGMTGKVLGQAQQTTAASRIGQVGQAMEGVGSFIGKGVDFLPGQSGNAEALKNKFGQTKMNVTDSQVILPMPNTFQVLDGATWAPIDADPSFIGLLTKVAGDLTQGGGIDAVMAAGSSLLKEMTGGLMNRLLAEGGGEGLYQAYTKSLENPFTDVAFQSMQRRTFQLTWQLFPKSASEMMSIKGIINMFRLHMHPNLNEGTNGNWLDFPSMVIPTCLFMGSPSPFLPKIAMSVINNVTVNSSPNAMWTVHSDGMPPHIQFSIEIQETQPLLKEDIGAGY
jgi:hypothetical protein